MIVEDVMQCPRGPSVLHSGPPNPRVYVGGENVSAHDLSERDSYTDNSVYCPHSESHTISMCSGQTGIIISTLSKGR